MVRGPFARACVLVSTLTKARQYDAATADARARVESTPADVGRLWDVEDGYRRKEMGRERQASLNGLSGPTHIRLPRPAVEQALEHGAYLNVVRTWLNV